MRSTTAQSAYQADIRCYGGKICLCSATHEIGCRAVRLMHRAVRTREVLAESARWHTTGGGSRVLQCCDLLLGSRGYARQLMGHHTLAGCAAQTTSSCRRCRATHAQPNLKHTAWMVIALERPMHSTYSTPCRACAHLFAAHAASYSAQAGLFATARPHLRAAPSRHGAATPGKRGTACHPLAALAPRRLQYTPHLHRCLKHHA